MRAVRDEVADDADFGSGNAERHSLADGPPQSPIMTEVVQPADDRAEDGSPEDIFLPNGSGESVTAFAHFHRAEIARMAGWRDRIDRTTNWAITLVAAMLSLSLSTPNSHHSVLVFAMVLACLMLLIESRRYRFFDVYRSRVRRLERNYYARLFDRSVRADPDWRRQMARDLAKPTFSMSMTEAVSRRLRRTYLWILLILLCAWISKVAYPTSGPVHSATVADWLANAGIGPVPGGVVSAFVSLLYIGIVTLAARSPDRRGEFAHGDAHM